MNYGSKIRRYRKAEKYSQLELECMCKFASGMISRIENGNINPTKETLMKIAYILQLTLEERIDLFGLEDLDLYINISKIVSA